MKKEHTIKYKAKDEFSNGWLYGQGFYVDPDNDVGYIADGISYYARVDKETVCQAVGRVHNFEVLYENDIIEGHLYADDSKIKGRIVYDYEIFCYCVEDDFGKLTELSKVNSIKVTGNFFENIQKSTSENEKKCKDV